MGLDPQQNVTRGRLYSCLDFGGKIQENNSTRNHGLLFFPANSEHIFEDNCNSVARVVAMRFKATGFNLRLKSCTNKERLS